MVSDCLLEDRKRALRDLVLLQLAQLGLIELRLGNMEVLTEEK